MKKGKKIMIVTIGLICFLLTYVMCMQFKVIEETNITEIENLRETELTEKLATWKEKYEETNIKLQEAKQKIEEYRQKRESNQETSDLLDNELSQARRIVGKDDVKGNGIIITLKDNPDEVEGIISQEDLVELINELKLAGAEAISINDNRIVNMSDIVYTDCIMVNTKRVVSPYIIKVIGNQKYIESALTTKTVGYIDKHRSKGKDITIEKQNNIRILKYDGELKLDYIKVKEEQ